MSRITRFSARKRTGACAPSKTSRPASTRPLEALACAYRGWFNRRKRLTDEPLDQIDDQKQDNRAKCGRNNGANDASAEGQTEP